MLSVKKRALSPTPNRSLKQVPSLLESLEKGAFMYITINVSKNSPTRERNEIKVTSPFHYTSKGSHPGTLYYTRLPANMSEEEVIGNIAQRNWDFVSNSEYNFLVVFVETSCNGQNWVMVRDRYGSQRVLIREAPNRLIVTTDPRAVRQGQTQWNPVALHHALSSRIITEDALEEGVSVLPFSSGLEYDDNGGLSVIATEGKKLKILENRDRLSDDSLIESIKDSIYQSYWQIDKTQPIAVLLSGGVDSFILAATACQTFKKVIAYTPTWKEGSNPELDRAITFSKKLGIEHRIITISPSDFKSSFFETIEANGVPNRNYSSLILHALLKRIPEVNILYGEYADTMFGSFPIKAGIMDRKYSLILRGIPEIIIPKRAKKLTSGIKTHNLSQLIKIPSITESFIIEQIKNIGPHTSNNKKREAPKPFTRITGIEFNLRTSCSQHMIEIETSALLLGKTIITPFYNQRMVAISNRLTNRQMFGMSELSIRKNFRKDTSKQVKPLLKELACQFIDPEHIYLKKLGFPTPFTRWIRDLSNSSDTPSIQNFTENQDPEQIWSAINLVYVTQLSAR